MSKIRLLVFLSTILIVGIIATVISLYARGYRLNSKTMGVDPNGLLVMKSNPDGAQIYVNGELNTATNATIPLPPGTYDISVRKEGFISWNKRLTIEKEIVTEATAHLFKNAPSLTAVTFNSVETIVPSSDFSKLSYVVPVDKNDSEIGGLWYIETLNLPLGFARDPKRVTDGNLVGASWIWSPDDRQILLTTSSGSYLFDTGTFTSQSQRVNVASQKDEILADWELEKEKILNAKMKKLPDEFEEILNSFALAINFSPDEDMVLYTASQSATIPQKLIKELPGSSTQAETRGIKPNHTYVYDIKEDRNFLVNENSETLQITGGHNGTAEKLITWYPSSRHLILAEEGKVSIMDYDGTNKQVVYAGGYVSPYAYPTLSLDRLLILTNFGATDSPPNLYSMGIK